MRAIPRDGGLRGRSRGSCRSGRARLTPALSQREILPADPRHLLDPGLLQPRGCEAGTPSSTPGVPRQRRDLILPGHKPFSPGAGDRAGVSSEAAWPSALAGQPPILEPEPHPGACSPPEGSAHRYQSSEPPAQGCAPSTGVCSPLPWPYTSLSRDLQPRQSRGPPLPREGSEGVSAAASTPPAAARPPTAGETEAAVTRAGPRGG